MNSPVSGFIYLKSGRMPTLLVPSLMFSNKIANIDEYRIFTSSSQYVITSVSLFVSVSDGSMLTVSSKANYEDY